MVVAIGSGKGGTGKTTVATNLAVVGRQAGRRVQLLDCDVEEPNCHLFFTPTLQRRCKVTVPVPAVDRARCTYCGECARVCQYGAIVCMDRDVLFFPELCHSCGGCGRICPEQAIREEPREVGIVEEGRADGLSFASGRLNVGEARAVPIIAEVKKRIDRRATVLIDAPPGASCPMIETIRGCEYVCLVAEPTAFGLHDLALTVEVVRILGRPIGVLINRVGLGDDRVRQYCQREGLAILMELPNDQRIARACSDGQSIVQVLPQYKARFVELLSRIESEISRAGKDDAPCRARQAGP